MGFKKENKQSDYKTSEISKYKKNNGDKKEFINLIEKEINKLYTKHSKICAIYTDLYEKAKKAEKEKDKSENILEEKKSELEIYKKKINKDSTKCQIIKKEKNKYLVITYENGTTIKLPLNNQ